MRKVSGIGGQLTAQPFLLFLQFLQHAFHVVLVAPLQQQTDGLAGNDVTQRVREGCFVAAVCIQLFAQPDDLRVFQNIGGGGVFGGVHGIVFMWG